MPKSATKSVTARDLMHTDLIRLDAEASLASAAETLTEARISGAPVVDSSERLVGVFSLRDAARSELEAGSDYGRRASENAVPDWSDDDLDDGLTLEREISLREGYRSDNGSGGCVGDWMNPSVISVTSDADLKEICKIMASEKIHRVFVVDGRRLLGVISALDVVAHVAGE